MCKLRLSALSSELFFGDNEKVCENIKSPKVKGNEQKLSEREEKKQQLINQIYLLV